MLRTHEFPKNDLDFKNEQQRHIFTNEASRTITDTQKELPDFVLYFVEASSLFKTPCFKYFFWDLFVKVTLFSN